ncbi:MAG TPA: hypothetical protein VGX95_07405 [Xanthobacteraceae bacterium]|jgi:hypothetical protein|nr:hypothetical protein [Xanthobacteraceae bacterium]
MASKRATKIDAVLRHLAAGGDIGDFPGTKYENLALVRTVVRRGLISWDGEGNRYTLTPAGWSELAPRRFGLPSLVASTAIGAAIGAAALAFVFLPGLKWQGSAHGHATASLAAEKPVVAPVSAPADVGGRSVAPMTATAAPAAPAAAAAPTEPAPPGSEEPAAETPPPKQAAVKKPHRRTVRRPEQTNPFANPWRTREPSYSRYGQGSWYSYR